MRASLILAAVAPLAYAGLVARSATTIVKAIDNIETYIATLNSTVNKLGAPGALTNIPIVLSIQTASDNLNQAINNATAAAAASKSLSGSDSGKVASAVLGLPPQVSSVVKNLVVHKPTFDKALFSFGSISPQVKKDLQQQQNSTLVFASVLTPKLTAAYQSIAPSIVKQINDTFTAGITYFSNTGGNIPIPPIFN